MNNIKLAKEEIYENKIMGMNFDGKIIAVEEIRQKDWE
jgi:hypothetical protein